jgi:DNA-binding Lrp family transcriptional regulator
MVRLTGTPNSTFLQALLMRNPAGDLQRDIKNQPKFFIQYKTVRLRSSQSLKKRSHVELDLISEMMKNSRRSDRELARAIHASQPTVTRTRRKMEKSGLIREYTMIPDFKKLGYKICSITFATFRETSDVEALRKAIEVYQHRLAEIPQAILIERGLGMGANGVVIALHKDYSSLSEFEKWMKQFSFISSFQLSHFLIDLEDEIHYRYLTFSTLADHFPKLPSDQKKE